MVEEKSADTKEKPESKRESKVTPFSEWMIAAAGLILVVCAVGATLYRALTEEKTPPRIEVKVDSFAPNGDGYLVKFSVKNTGNQPAAAVTIEGELKDGTESAETSSATLTYAPANSIRRGGLYFTKNPQQFALQIRATGYEEP